MVTVLCIMQLALGLQVMAALSRSYIECANRAVKCYRSSLEKLAKNNSQFKERNGLTSSKMQQLAKEMRCAIRSHSITGDVADLRH